jgi:hypothetical protein
MGKQGRPEAGIDEYREWERRLDRYGVSETSLELFVTVNKSPALRGLVS